MESRAGGHREAGRPGLVAGLRLWWADRGEKSWGSDLHLVCTVSF